MSILLQQKNVGDYSYMSSPNIYYRANIKRTALSADALSTVLCFIFSRLERWLGLL